MEESIASTVGEEEEEEHLPEGFNFVTTRWVIPQKIDMITFVGKHVVALANDVNISFFDLVENTEITYSANSKQSGDGVDCIAGHKAKIFVFAEKVKNARIFVMIYPTFEIITELLDNDVNRYKALCMTEMDLVIGFSGFPNYIITVWCWRTAHRLLCLPTEVMGREQIYVASSHQLLVCQSSGACLNMWEIAPCFRRTFMMKRTLAAVKLPSENPVLDLVQICWSSEGMLYGVDSNANLYCVQSDGINMVTNLEWTDGLEGERKPCICAYGTGFLIYGPDDNLRCLKKNENSWAVTTVLPQSDVICVLISNSTQDTCAFYTARGLLYHIMGTEDNLQCYLSSVKLRNIKRVQMIAPAYAHVAMIDNIGNLAIYDVHTANLVNLKKIAGKDVSIQASPVDPLIVLYGEVGANYGIKLVTFKNPELNEKGHQCLTNQIVSQVKFSPTGREMVVCAMSAGHIFIYKVKEDYALSLVRYTEVGRGLADCMLMPVAGIMRCFSVVLFSDKYRIGERITCINAVSGKDNKFAGKLAGPYSRLVALAQPDTMLAVPHLSRHYHILKLAADKGVTVQVKMGPIIDSGHDLKLFDAFSNVDALITFGYDGNVIIREPTAPIGYELKLVSTHRYEQGIREALIDNKNKILVTLAGNSTVTVQYLRRSKRTRPVVHQINDSLIDNEDVMAMFDKDEKNYLDIVEEKKVHMEKIDWSKQRDEVVAEFLQLQVRLRALLEENLAEVPLHQLSLSEFNLHFENKKERYKQAEKERELIRLKTEARITAQDKVRDWIMKTCWEAVTTHRTKILGIFTHYQVENYPCIPIERDTWPELTLMQEFRSIEMENDADVFRPWEEYVETPREENTNQNTSAVLMKSVSVKSLKSAERLRKSTESQVSQTLKQVDSFTENYSLTGTGAHNYITLPNYDIPQMLRYSFLHMDWGRHICKLNVHHMRGWFNKEFENLMAAKRREVSLVIERNERLRFINEELNKLSDLRGSCNHLHMLIQDPEWKQDEEPERLAKVDPEECSIEPYISPSQIVIIPPEPGPKDDFRERALMEMMDGVLEKLWHEEIKKPIPKPQCMLDKDPEHFNEEDLRQVFEWEKKVEFRNEERNRYRKMLHAEYAKLAGILTEGVVKFNLKVKELHLTKLRVDTVIGQETLLLMRQRRVNLDRLEESEAVEDMRQRISRYEQEINTLQDELKQMQDQVDDCHAATDALAVKEKQVEKIFKNTFSDLSPVIVDQCYKFYRKRPKWQQRNLTPTVMYELATAVSGDRRMNLHPDCIDYLKAIENLDQPSNMPAVLDDGLWANVVRLRRFKIDLEIKMRALVTEKAAIDMTFATWSKAIGARKLAVLRLQREMENHRRDSELRARNKTIQLVLPSGQVEITTSGRFSDFDDAALVLRDDIEKINELILMVGALKLRMMRRQIEFRKGILAKEWAHAQMRMKLRHAEQELASYRRIKIPKELQLFLKNKELGYTEEWEYARMEKEQEATRVSISRILDMHIQTKNELELRVNSVEMKTENLDSTLTDLNVKVSEKRLNTDPLEPIRVRRVFKKRMESIVERARLVREVQENHTTIVLLQTELELMRLKTYPTLAVVQHVP